MIIDINLTTDYRINKLEDLVKLKTLQEVTGIKINISALARQLNVDRRTVKKYINGFKKSKERNRESYIDSFESTIRDLIFSENKVFSYKSILYRYLCDNYGMNCAESSFRRYISNHEEFNSYFKEKRHKIVGPKTQSRFETDPGQQAQLDWKESIDFVLKDGEVVVVNIFVLILGFSRFRVYQLSLTKTQDVLFHYMDQAFQIMGGVPKEILTDNMKTVMDDSRTEYTKGKVNPRFQQFADDYGFKVHPCIAGRPNTKAKVESPMRILEEIKAYSGDLDYKGLVDQIQKINDRENGRFHEEYHMVPLLGLEKERDFLSPLPKDTIRSHYQVHTDTVKVNQSSMISYKSNQYSVQPKYIGKLLKIQIYDRKIHLYYEDTLVAIHDISERKLNYIESHYIEILGNTLPYENIDLEKIAKENLKKIGEKYTHDNLIQSSD